MRKLIFMLSFLGSLGVASLAKAQQKESPWHFSGYVKYMQTLDVTHGLDSMQDSHLLHNRLNLDYEPNAALRFHIGVRNRIFYGDQLRYPGFKSLVDVNNDYWNLSTWMIDKQNLKMLSEIDRLYAEWEKGSWVVTFGRQRINWGINTVWNPNDIFNAYSFFDFDYEERPGSDALRAVYYYGFAGRIEVAATVADDWKRFTGALLWKTNHWGYDFQLLSGMMQNNVVAGTGWAGNIGNAGFKGEVSYFHDLSDSVKHQNVVVGSITGDYAFQNGFYLNSSVLYNSQGTTQKGLAGLSTLTTDRLNAKNLIPFRYALFLQGSYAFSPIFNASLAGMYFPGNNGAYVGPQLTLSISDNVTLDVISQVFTAKLQQDYKVAQGQLFFRLKWSF